TKLMVGLAALLGMFGLLAYQSLKGLSTMRVSLDRWDSGLQTIREVKDTGIQLRDAGTSLRDALIAEDVKDAQAHLADAQKRMVTAEATLKAFVGHIVTERNKQAAKDLEPKLERERAEREEIFKLVAAGKKAEADKRLIVLKPLIQEIYRDMDEIAANRYDF